MKNLKKYLSILIISFKSYNVFLGDILGKNIIYIIRVLVIITMFKAIYKFGNASNTSYTLEQVSWGLIFVQALVTSRPQVAEDIQSEIKSGKITNYLLNPISYLGYKFIVNFTQYSYNLAINLSIGIILGFLYLGGIDTSLYGILGGTVLLIGSMFIQYFAYFLIGLFAFYIEDIAGVRMIYNFLDRLFGGNILPIPFFPAFIQNIVYLSPFAYTGYTSGLIFSKFEGDKFLYYLSVQFTWMLIYVIVINLIYRNARKHLVVNGG
ncbi:MAG: hypothetical protein PHS92_00395 [Candidatus Gracilibacteria bacterium]|nr:hypothetical protein [Candidatus Gracilibacteria bacterium]